MSIDRTHTALALAVLIGAGSLLPLAASAQSNCQWYATTALRQQQDNEKLRCGFKGDAWNTNLKTHLDWCATVAPDVWKAAAQKRDQELQACAGKKK